MNVAVNDTEATGSRFNAQAGWRLDVTAQPFGADPRGVRDSTEAILHALDWVTGLTLQAAKRTAEELSLLPMQDVRDPRGVENRRQDGKVRMIFPAVIPYVPTLYFPSGIYRISDSLRHHRPDLYNSGGSELATQIRICGDGPGRSILKLEDRAPGFAGEEPKPLLALVNGQNSAVAMSNYVEDLTLDCGRGNPAAVGLDFYANNSGAVRRLEIRAGEGSGWGGLCIHRGNPSGMLLQDVEVEGFEYGLVMNTRKGTMFVSGERLHFRNQRRAAILAGNLSMNLRAIETENVPCGVEFLSPHGHLVLVDSRFRGKGPSAFRMGRGVAYLSNVSASGFEQIFEGQTDTAEASVDWVCVDGACRQTQTPGGMPRLRVEDPPVFSSAGGRKVWVQDFGAAGDGVTDDSSALQAAFMAGASQVHFGPGRYLLTAPIEIPQEVEQVNFHFCDLVTGEPLASLREQGVFVIGGNGPQPLLFEKLFAWEQFRGECVAIEHAGTRTLVIRDVHTQTLSLYRNRVEGGKVFLENVACTTGVVPGTAGHGRIPLRFRGQQVWARQLNPERGHPMVVNDGGSLWVLGFKTEDDATAFLTLNGGRSEILGGILNCGGRREPAFSCVDSWIRVTATTNAWGGPTFDTVVKETVDGKESRRMASELPLRHFTAERAALFSLPLHVSVENSK